MAVAVVVAMAIVVAVATVVVVALAVAVASVVVVAVVVATAVVVVVCLSTNLHRGTHVCRRRVHLASRLNSPMDVLYKRRYVRRCLRCVSSGDPIHPVELGTGVRVPQSWSQVRERIAMTAVAVCRCACAG